MYDVCLQAERLPQAQVEPDGLEFSVLEREQVQAPAARMSGELISMLFKCQ